MIKKKWILALIFIIIPLIVLNVIVCYPNPESNTQTVDILIYNGNGTGKNCVQGIETSLDTVNNQNLVPGYYFKYNTSKIISSTILSNYNILIMPGGTSGKTYLNTIDGSTIRNFVSNGHGYIGICAGAYAGCTYVDGMYRGWGIAHHVNSKVYNHEGNLQVSIPASASQLLGNSETITIAHYNGAAMYGNGFTKFADYSSCSYRRYAAIVGDTYGNGRVVLCGPHPELAPQNPILLTKMILWTVQKK